VKAKVNKHKLPLGRELDAKIAEDVMGWENVHRANTGKGGASEYVGKKPDKLGRFRKARVPDFCNNPRIAAEIEPRMKQLGIWKQYETELSRITRADGLPSQWGTPEQVCHAALKAVNKARNPRLKLIKK
jgi:hypothetical protein